MIRIIKYLAIEIFLLIFLLLLLPALLIREKVGIDIEGGKPILPLQLNKFYTQPLNNPTQSLNSISLQLKNPLIQDNSQISIEIINYSGEIFQDFTVFGSNIGDPSWIKLKFAPITEKNLILKVYADSPRDDSLYLFADKDGRFDLKTTYRLPNFKQRLIQNFQTQISEFQQRSFWHNLFYLIILIFLHLYLLKQLNETRQKI